MKIARMALFAAAFVAAAAVAPLSSTGGESGRAKLALTIDIDGAIGPASARQLKEGLATAVERNAEVVILEMNTPGGLATSMREMIADIVASPIPVIGYVAPSGAHAASAGTYILYATHLAAMAPGTNLGAATPVELGGSPSPLPGPADNKGGEGQKNATEPKTSDAMMAKVTNDAVAFIRSLAELRGRNADWAEKAVREAASLSATAALQQHVIEIIARDPADLLQQADGRTVEVAGKKEVLATKDVKDETLEAGPLIRLLSVITDPNVAIILLLVGVYGLVFEFSNPGMVAPGVIGTLALLLALYALDLLPINYAGLALMLLGIAFLVMEAFNPTVVLGLGGVAAFFLGAAMLLKVRGPGFEMSWFVIGIAGALTLGLALLSGSYLWAARKRPSRVGAQAMNGLPVEIIDWSGDEGHVFAQGERWRAKADEPLAPGDSAEVVGVKDLVLMVRRRATGQTSNGASR
ncbi:membrane-bound serine protease (ClpP class) [Mesorhizobium soli]|uniref:NfeD family protein n=1 Tax=Pseudaminobacter soli (ex Li et al. 2025) TaxID=1295366 RepID=UPI0024753809|nr:nodulation protein NfeD [Mesorhizobium soli]MDH6230255.1 membrane-bound serine protease (ClpP class) [Mesorhizobium soli]